MYRSSLVTGLAAAFGVMSLALGLTAAVTGNWLVLFPAALFAVVTYFMWYHASGRLADRVYRSAERAATRTDGSVANGGGGRRRSATAGRGGFGAGPREDWERPGAQSRERVRRERVRQERARRRRARDHVTGVGGGSRRRAPADGATGMTAREAASVLGVGPDAPGEDVRSAYRERIREVHPDTEGGDEDEFKRVRDAYERLSE